MYGVNCHHGSKYELRIHVRSLLKTQHFKASNLYRLLALDGCVADHKLWMNGNCGSLLLSRIMREYLLYIASLGKDDSMAYT